MSHSSVSAQTSLPVAAARGRHGHLRRRAEPYLYLLPTAVVVAAVVIYPLIYTVGLSLFDVNLLQLARARFVGLGNYADMLGDGTFWHSLGVTAAYTFATVVVSLGL